MKIKFTDNIGDFKVRELRFFGKNTRNRIFFMEGTSFIIGPSLKFSFSKEGFVEFIKNAIISTLVMYGYDFNVFKEEDRDLLEKIQTSLELTPENEVIISKKEMRNLLKNISIKIRNYFQKDDEPIEEEDI